MSMTDHRLTKQKIQKTDAYKKMSFIQRKIAGSFSNLKTIGHSLKVIEHIGFAQWVKQTKSTYLNQLLIHDILKNEIIKNGKNGR